MKTFRPSNQVVACYVIVFFVITQGRADDSTLREHRHIDPVGVTFHLFTRRNMNIPKILQLNNDTALNSSNFDVRLPVKIFVHGWTNTAVWGYRSASNWLKMKDCNAISVDWSFYAIDEYFAASKNTAIAGSTLGAFVDYLVSKGTPLNSFHLVGFSLGAHVVGNAGASVKSGKVPRITGLDPASIGFPLESPEIILDRSDALFVDVIHTKVALAERMGHADFYPNGGGILKLPQPGCPFFPDLGQNCCNHCRAMALFEESIISPKGFLAKECDSYLSFLIGTCDDNASILMGEPTPMNARGTFYLKTNGNTPFVLG